MRYGIYYNWQYFGCSTLPLLNGALKDICEEFTDHDLDIVFKECINYLENELRLLSHCKCYKLKREHKRMFNLYKYRLKQLSKMGWLG